jgi:hypothetical protein
LFPTIFTFGYPTDVGSVPRASVGLKVAMYVVSSVGSMLVLVEEDGGAVLASSNIVDGENVGPGLGSAVKPMVASEVCDIVWSTVGRAVLANTIGLSVGDVVGTSGALGILVLLEGVDGISFGSTQKSAPYKLGPPSGSKHPGTASVSLRW